MNSIWTVKHFKDALQRIQLTTSDKAVLQAFLDAEGHTLTAKAMADSARLSDGGAATLRFQSLARKFRKVLSDSKSAEDFDPEWWKYVAMGGWPTEYLEWTLHLELKAALLSMGWRTREELPNEAEGIPAEEARTFREGATRQIFVNAYERSAPAREACVAQLGTVCHVCEVDLVTVYGEVARGYIQVHHLRPLADAGGEYEVNPVTDLIPVCPNCHAMLHQRRPAYTPDELRGMLRIRS